MLNLAIPHPMSAKGLHHPLPQGEGRGEGVRLYLLLLLFLGMIFLPFAVQAQETGVTAPVSSENAIKADLARQILLLTPLRDDLEKSIEAGLKRYPENEREEIGRVVRASLDVDALEAMALAALVDIFTAEELTAMRDYYASDAGRSILSKMPAYSDKIGPEIAKVLDAAMADWLQNRRRK